MSDSKRPDPMECPSCGVAMNLHAEKLVDPRDEREAARMDPRMGGVIEEFHTCPACGAVGERPGR